MKTFLKYSWDSIKLALRVWYGLLLIGLILLPIEIIMILAMLRYIAPMLSLLV